MNAAAARQRDVATVFATKVKPRLRIADGGCWEWTGYRTSRGYGQVRFEDVVTYVHRIAAELIHGPIPSGSHVDHLCRNTSCARPDHLEIVSPGENVRRGLNGALKQTCRHGHPWVRENWRVNKNGSRRCRLCHNEDERRRRARRRAAA